MGRGVGGGLKSNSVSIVIWSRMAENKNPKEILDKKIMKKNPKSSVPDGKALSFARTQLCHQVSLLISLADERGGKGSRIVQTEFIPSGTISGLSFDLGLQTISDAPGKKNPTHLCRSPMTSLRKMSNLTTK